MIYALDESNRIVGLTDDCNLPPVLQEKESVGKRSSSADVERILELNPDLVIVSGLSPDEIVNQIESAGVPVLKYWALHVDTLLPMVEDIGLILGEDDKAEMLRDFIESNYEIIEERIENLSVNEKPNVYFMSMGHFDWTGNSISSAHKRIVDSGGVNIAANLEAKVPHVDLEWVIEQNPDVIIYSMSYSQYEGSTPTIEEMKTKRQEIMTLPGFDEIDAVQNGRVYVMDISMASGMTEVVTLFYYAQWFQPALFQDVDPESIHQDIFQKYFDEGLVGHWAYPTL